MLWVIACIALGVLTGDLLRRARLRREQEARWAREDDESLRRLRGARRTPSRPA